MSFILFLKIFSMSVLVALTALYLRENASLALDFRFNTYALLSAFSAVINLILLVMISRPRFRNRTVVWFAAFISLLTVWCVTEMFGRLSATAATAVFWADWGVVGWTLMPAIFLIFARVYTGSREDLSKPSFWVALLVAPIFFMTLTLTTDLINNHNPLAAYYNPWGYDLSQGPFFKWFLLWLEVMFISSLYSLIRFRKKSKDLQQRKQIKLFVISVLIPLVGGSITDGILPIMGITTVFPTATLLISVMSLMIAYGIKRYGLFVVSPAAYSDTILATMTEAVVGVDGNFNIQYVNEGAQKLLGSHPEDLAGVSIAAIFSNEVFREVHPQVLEEMRTKDTFTLEETQVVSRVRGVVPVSLAVSTVRRSDGERAGYIIVLTDITVQKALTASLRRERDTVRSIIGSMSECLVVVDRNFRITLMNSAAESMLGVKAAELLGRPFYEAVEISRNGIPLRREEYLLVRTIHENKSILVMRNDDYTLKVKSGKVIPFEATTAVMRKGSNVDGAMIVWRDITSEKHAAEVIERKVIEQTHRVREEQARFEASIQSLELGFIMTDSKGDILTVNRAAGSLLGPASLTEGIKSVDKALSVNLAEEMKKALTTGKPQGLSDVSFRDKYLRLFITPIVMSGEAIGCVLLLQDITQEKVLQRSKEEFFSIASHELRTPLSAIRGNTAMIQSYFGDKVKNEDFNNMISDIHESSVRLIELVNDFLDASRLEQGKMTFDLEPFPIKDLVQEVVKEISAVAKAGVSVEYKMKESPDVYADRNKVKQIIYNLLGNSLKFTDKGKVTISSKTENGLLCLEVSDTGKGIPKDKQIFLFHKFQQAGESLLTRDTTKGTGLGLYISKLLAERMGGEVGLARSEPGKGTTFFLALPLAGAEASPKPARKKTNVI